MEPPEDEGRALATHRKTGRPSMPAHHRKTGTIGFRPTPSERALIERQAAARGLSPGAFALACCVANDAVPAAGSAEVIQRLDPALLRELKALANNVNQAVRRLHQMDNAAAVPQIERRLAVIEASLDWMRETIIEDMDAAGV